MKKHIYYLLVLFLTGTYAQVKTNAPCIFLGQLHFVGDKATIVVKAVYYGSHEYDDYEFFKNLAKKNKLRYSDYFSEIKGEGGGGATALEFLPDNCSELYEAVVNNKAKAWNLKAGQTFYLTLIVFKGIPGDKKLPLFVIKDITYKKSNLEPVQDVRPFKHVSTNSEDNYGYFSANSELLLAKMKVLVVITDKHTAYITVENNKRIYFTRESRTPTKTGYKDLYKTKEGYFILNIDQIIHFDEHRSYRNGTLSLMINGLKKDLKIYGWDEETDSYNR